MTWQRYSQNGAMFTGQNPVEHVTWEAWGNLQLNTNGIVLQSRWLDTGWNAFTVTVGKSCLCAVVIKGSTLTLFRSAPDAIKTRQPTGTNVSWY